MERRESRCCVAAFNVIKKSGIFIFFESATFQESSVAWNRSHSNAPISAFITSHLPLSPSLSLTHSSHTRTRVLSHALEARCVRRLKMLMVMFLI